MRIRHLCVGQFTVEPFGTFVKKYGSGVLPSYYKVFSGWEASNLCKVSPSSLFCQGMLGEGWEESVPWAPKHHLMLGKGGGDMQTGLFSSYGDAALYATEEGCLEGRARLGGICLKTPPNSFSVAGDAKKRKGSCKRLQRGKPVSKGEESLKVGCFSVVGR